MLGRSGRAVPNQFIIDIDGWEYFQSYGVIICKRTRYDASIKNELDEKYYNYSKTTSKYLSKFLGESTKQIKERIKNGDYLLTNLN